MGDLSLEGFSDGAWLLVDSAPIVYILENHPLQAPRFRPLFAAHERGEIRLAVSAVTIAEVLTGPLRAGEEAMARRYRAHLERWRVVPLDAELAERAARIRAVYRLKLPDAVQAASALSIGAEALVTYDRDFTGVMGLRILA